MPRSSKSKQENVLAAVVSDYVAVSEISFPMVNLKPAKGEKRPPVAPAPVVDTTGCINYYVRFLDRNTDNAAAVNLAFVTEAQARGHPGCWVTDLVLGDPFVLDPRQPGKWVRTPGHRPRHDGRPSYYHCVHHLVAHAFLTVPDAPQPPPPIVSTPASERNSLLAS